MTSSLSKCQTRKHENLRWPEDIVAQTDRATLRALVCTAEALNASGITDPYELYKYMHSSDVGTCIGSGMGGVTSMAQMLRTVETKNEFKMIFSKKRTSLVVKRRPVSLTKFLVSSIRLRDGSIFSSYHQVDPSKFRLEHGKFYLFSVIPILMSFQCHRPSIFRNRVQHYSFRKS